MPEVDWMLVEAVFEAAVELPPGSRGAVLDARCAGDAELRAQVQSLLAAHDTSTGFLAPLGMADGDVAPAPGEIEIGSLVGAYRLTRELGRGGMGTVYLASRADGAFAHDVAIKVTRYTLVDRDLARRFQAERQILASLRHPNVVTLVDGGTTASGQAYLAMEYVDGQPITAWVRSQRASLEQRLRMFRQVCSAVHYAHQNGVVHRDLKPGNILVDRTGTPKVLDFGIAKLVEADREDTQEGVFAAPLTPNYASPEQLRGLPVTTATDVYALGVLLYETVSDMRPYDIAGQPLDAVLHTVLHERVRRPSAAAWLAASDLPYSGERLRGDIDAIVARAMHVEPGQRYASAEELSADVARFLGGKPVLAREPSAGYVLRKLASQHRAAVGVGVGGAIVVLVAFGLALWQRQVALRQHQVAEARFNDVRRLANSLIFKIHDEVAKIQGSTAARQLIVSEALVYLDTLAKASDDDALQVELAKGYKQVARALGDPQAANLGDREGALANLRRSLAILEPLLNSPTVGSAASYEAIHAHRLLAQVHGAIGNRDEAIASSRAALALAERWVTAEPTSAEARRALGSAYFNLAHATKPAEAAIPIWDQAGRVFQQLLDEQPDDLDRMRNVALVNKYSAGLLEQLTRYDEAAARYQQALALDERRLQAQPDNRLAQFDVAIDLANTGHVLLVAGNDVAALDFYERSVAMREGLVERDPKDMLARMVLGRVYAITALAHDQVSDAARAADRAARALAILETQAASSPDKEPKRYAAMALHVQASLAARADRRAEACRQWRRAAELIEAAGEHADATSGRVKWVAAVLRETAACGR